MKIFSKKRKIIGFIAILLVAIIIAIFITAIIIKNNQITSEKYSATTANSGSSLISNYILNGITIGGITGKMDVLNTYDATATAEDIAMGKTAYVKGEKITGTRIEPISNEDLQISADNVYYADLDDDGTVDGVIFADLAGKEESGMWPEGNDWGTYVIPQEENLKQYYIKGEYTDEHFRTGKVIAPIEENDKSKNDRFYIMALEDINPGTHYCWYDAALGKLDKPIGTSDNDFGQGKLNTEYANDKWNDPKLPWGTHNTSSYGLLDMWEVIQDEIAKGWFVPSKSEWAAFEATFNIDKNDTYGFTEFGGNYWSSSQYDTEYVFYADFNNGDIFFLDVGDLFSVRLATTF